MKITTPPPANVHTLNDLPDYYLGCLLYYDDESDDNCKWTVYDGCNYVKCATKRDALDYIAGLRHSDTSEARRMLVGARIDVNSAMTRLDRAAVHSEPARRLQLQRLSVMLRPVLVDLDNIILPNNNSYDKET